jgi:hypothetical protein
MKAAVNALIGSAIGIGLILTVIWSGLLAYGLGYLVWSMF